MARSEPIPVSILIDQAGGDWGDRALLDPLINKTIQAANRFLVEETGQPMPPVAAELSVLLTDDDEIRAINGEWRSKDAATNVLSFPSKALKPGEMPLPVLGDIVLAFETLVREAEDEGKKFSDHLAHLLVHGYLHLVGYDHLNDADADVMESLEIRILATIGLSNPYADSEPIAN